jgi:predicted membrane channel-forming protein YqfA (hemolysin III family)
MSADADQKRLARLATISALLVVASFLAAKAARDATLLSRFSIKSLPLFIGLSAALSLPLIILAGKLMVRFGPHHLVPAMNAVSGLIALVEWLLISHYPRPVAVITFFHLNIASAILVSGFWSIVNERFDITSAKRHIGRIGMGATLGGILGGVIAERTAVYLAPDSILAVLAGMQLVCAGTLYFLGRGHAPLVVDPSKPVVSTWAALGGVARSQLLRKAGLIVVLTAIGAGALDYVFKADLVGHGSQASLLRQLAVFYTVTNVITAIVQVALCGPVLTWLGVPRSVSTLPYTLTGFSILSLIIPLPTTATIARGAEFVTRNSLYRAGYELLYAPLPPDQKRPTKVVLDVGADKLGDILSAQLVGGIVLFAADSRTGLLLTAAIAGAVSIIVTLRLPRSYTKSLESSLLEAVGERPAIAEGPEPWVSLTEMPSLGHPGDVIPLRWRGRQRKPRRIPTPAPIPPPTAPSSTAAFVRLVQELRSNDAARIRRALAEPLPLDAASLVIQLVDGDDDIARDACTALRAIAPRCTGLLVDALTDQSRAEKLRRRLPVIIAAGIPELAVWGLWRGLGDPCFDVRYYCSTALSSLGVDIRVGHVGREEVFEYVRKELLVGRDEWKARKLVGDPVLELPAADSDFGLTHVFRVLGLVLPAEPLRVALHAVQTDDASLRGVALEYLEGILPPDVRAQLWPLLDESTPTDMNAVVDAATVESRSKHLLERMVAAATGEHPPVRKSG